MAPQFDVYAPLQDFPWAGGDVSFSGTVLLTRTRVPPDLSGLESSVSTAEWERAKHAKHWLVCRCADGELLRSEAINLVLLSLWLVKPTRAYAALRFEIGTENAGEKSMVRLLDRFSSIPEAAAPNFTDFDMQLASRYYSKLEALCRNRGRLNNAMVLTLAACTSHRWQTAIVCHAAAAETILTYSKARGLTNRLATAFACLVESDNDSRGRAFDEFLALYATRSDIVHGRMHEIVKGDKMPALSRFESLMRRLWSAVLTSIDYARILELGDGDRKEYIMRLQNGWTPQMLR